MCHIPKWSSIDTAPEWGSACIAVGNQFARFTSFHGDDVLERCSFFRLLSLVLRANGCAPNELRVDAAGRAKVEQRK